jgi:transglutaminase-like putative cysteine protease
LYVKETGLAPQPDYKTFISELPNGREGVRATLNIMSSIVRAYKALPWVRNFANEMTRSLPQKSYMRQAEALFYFVRDRIRYVHDIAGMEMVQTPDVTLHRGSGDCDDKSVLLAVLLQSLGHPTRFIAMGTKPGRFSHVFVETKVGNSWVPLDATEANPPGWRPPNIVERMQSNT